MMDYIRIREAFQNIMFNEDDHSYMGKQGKFTSVTTELKRYFKEFDSEYWSTYKAMQAEGISVKPLSNKRQIKTESKTYDLNNIKGDYKNKAKALREHWRDLATYGQIRGTLLHNYLEDHWLNKNKSYNPPDTLSKEDREKMEEELSIILAQADNFIKDYMDVLVPLDTEFVVYDSYYRIAGQIDVLFYNKKINGIWLGDYKTDKKIKSYNEFDKLLEPFNHLSDCELVKYSLQTYIYKIILEKNTGAKVENIKIIWFNKNNDNYVIVEPMNLEEEAKDILTLRRQRIIENGN